jgi:hypothetical protein
MNAALAPPGSGVVVAQTPGRRVLRSRPRELHLQKLGESDTRQMLLLYAPCYADFRFRAIVVELKISLLVRRIPKGKRWEDRLKPKYIPYQQIIRSIVKLPDPDREDRKKNVERWSADQGKLARRALDIGVEEIRRLAAQSRVHGGRGRGMAFARQAQDGGDRRNSRMGPGAW